MTRPTRLLLALAACKSSGDADEPDFFHPTAKVDGPMIVIEAGCKHGGITAVGQHAYCDSGRAATIRVPAATVGTGPQKITVTYERGRETRSVEVSVTVPAASTGPYVSIEKCVEDFSATDRSHVDLVVDGKGKLSCSTFHGACAKLEIRATPGGRLTLGDGKPVDVPASGELEVVAEFAAPMLAMKLDDFTTGGLGSKSPPLEVAYALDAGGKQATGKLVFEEASYEQGRMFGHWLRDLADGKLDRPAFTPPPAGARKTILFLDSRDKMMPTDRRGTIKDLAYVATIKETGRKEAGTCEFQSSGKTTVAKRFGIDAEVTVTSLADGKVLTTKAFPAPAGCPMVAMLDPNKPETAVMVNSDDVMKWLETLAKP